MDTHFIVNEKQGRVVAIMHPSLLRAAAENVAGFLTVMSQERHTITTAKACPEHLFGTSADMLMTEITTDDVITWAEHVARESTDATSPPENIGLLEIRLACAIQNIVAQTSEEDAAKAEAGKQG